MNVTFIYAPTMPTKIILDCDPGHDDAVALLLAWGNPDIELVGVTTVAGNQTIDKVTRNALAIAQVAGITGVPFARGAHRPLVREVEVAEHREVAGSGHLQSSRWRSAMVPVGTRRLREY